MFVGDRIRRLQLRWLARRLWSINVDKRGKRFQIFTTRSQRCESDNAITFSEQKVKYAISKTIKVYSLNYGDRNERNTKLGYYPETTQRVEVKQIKVNAYSSSQTPRCYVISRALSDYTVLPETRQR